MMRSMFDGVAGLRAHQTMMDVVGNNIANVNTAGFKASAVTFQEALTQVQQGPSVSLNPVQVGLGVTVASTDPIFTQGATQVTGRATDLAIQGDGFFAVQQGSQQLYTRAGSFSFDSAGKLVSPSGAQVMGWMADSTGAVNTNNAIQGISVPSGQVIPSRATATVEAGGNLSADAAVGTAVNKSINVYDSVGTAHALDLTFTKSAVDQWDVTGTVDANAATLTPSSVTFGTDGKITGGGTLAVSGYTPPGAAPMSFNVDLAGASPIVQFGGTSTIQIISQDGMPIGSLQGVKIANDGTVSGQFSNGQNMVLGEIATATFANPAGMVRVGDSSFSSSIASGVPLVGVPGVGSRGSLTAGSLEMSNVDLAQEFTNMIIAERGFQANSKVITSSDEMLQDLVNLKR